MIPQAVIWFFIAVLPPTETAPPTRHHAGILVQGGVYAGTGGDGGSASPGGH